MAWFRKPLPIHKQSIEHNFYCDIHLLIIGNCDGEFTFLSLAFSVYLTALLQCIEHCFDEPISLFLNYIIA